MLGVMACVWPLVGQAGPPPAHLKEHPITIDATLLVPASWWQVPGVTPSIYHSDPDSLDAPKTSERRELQLKPGKYKFISFTFDFPFRCESLRDVGVFEGAGSMCRRSRHPDAGD